MQRLTMINERISKQTSKLLSGKTIVITGASRGIGLAIGLTCAKDGANVAILAKTTTPQPTLEGKVLNIKALFILQLPKLQKRVAKPYLWFVTSGAKKMSKNVLKR